jgi:hypothetical protein
MLSIILSVFILKKQHQLNLHSHYTLFPQIEKTSYHKHRSGSFTICLVELQGCLLPVLLNCYGVYNLSCWITQCSPTVLLNCWSAYLLYCYLFYLFINMLHCYNASHLSCWTTGVHTNSPVELLQMLTICPVEPLGSALITCSCVESPVPKAAYQKVKHSSS